MKKLIQSILSLFLILLLEVTGYYAFVENRINDPLSNALESYYTEDLYYWLERNVREQASSRYASDLVLVDIAAVRTRTQIAELLDTISAVAPRAVILDVVFPALSGSNSTEDSLLVNAIRKIENLVLATNHYQDDTEEWRLERSFFADSVQATEAHAWLNGQVVRYYTPYNQLPNGTMIPTLGTCIAQALGDKDIPYTSDQEFTIGYLPMDWMVWHANKEAFDIQYLRNKVVVIGDCGDLRDYHNVPALSGGRARESGVNIHIRIALNEVLDIQVKNMPTWLGIGLQILFLWCLCLLFCCPYKKGYNNILQFAEQLGVLLIVVLLGWGIFHAFHCVLPLSLLLVGILLAPFVTDFIMSTTDCITNHKLTQLKK